MRLALVSIALFLLALQALPPGPWGFYRVKTKPSANVTQSPGGGLTIIDAEGNASRISGLR